MWVYLRIKKCNDKSVITLVMNKARGMYGPWRWGADPWEVGVLTPPPDPPPPPPPVDPPTVCWYLRNS